jgi:hypothetical protein
MTWKLMQSKLKTCMLKPHHQKMGKNHTKYTANKFFQNMAKFKHLYMRAINANCIHKEVKG